MYTYLMMGRSLNHAVLKIRKTTLFMGFEWNYTWKLFESELILTSEYKYSGVWMNLDGCQRMKNEKLL